MDGSTGLMKVTTPYFNFLDIKFQSRMVICLATVHYQSSLCKIAIIDHTYVPTYVRIIDRTYSKFPIDGLLIITIVWVHVITLPPANYKVYHVTPLVFNYLCAKNH